MEFGKIELNSSWRVFLQKLLFQLIAKYPVLWKPKFCKGGDRSPLLEADMLYVGLFMKRGSNSNVYVETV
jgi:hypothetical protein